MSEKGIFSKQLLRSGTFISANIYKAQAAQTKKDFISKINIFGKEARETKYWLELLVVTGYILVADRHIQSLIDDRRVNKAFNIYT